MRSLPLREFPTVQPGDLQGLSFPLCSHFLGYNEKPCVKAERRWPCGKQALVGRLRMLSHVWFRDWVVGVFSSCQFSSFVSQGVGGLSKLMCENFLGDFMSKQVWIPPLEEEVKVGPQKESRNPWGRSLALGLVGLLLQHLNLVFFLGCLHILLKCLQTRGRKKTFWGTQIRRVSLLWISEYSGFWDPLPDWLFRAKWHDLFMPGSRISLPGKYIPRPGPTLPAGPQDIGIWLEIPLVPYIPPYNVHPPCRAGSAEDSREGAAWPP